MGIKQLHYRGTQETKRELSSQLACCVPAMLAPAASQVLARVSPAPMNLGHCSQKCFPQFSGDVLLSVVPSVLGNWAVH